VIPAVVMAAGEGTRLRPLTERWPKPVLPIDGRPVLASLLRELAAGGVERCVVVVGHLSSQVEALAGDGSAFGLSVSFATQPRADGSADAVRRAGLEPPYLVVGADTLFRAGDIGRFAAGAEGFDGAIAVRREPPPEPPDRYGVRSVDGVVERVLDDDPSNPLAGAPLWLVGRSVADRFATLPGPPFELSRAFQDAVDGGARITAVEIGPTRDLTRPEDLVEENFPYLRGL
jgi:NDP-sugar pyrophosphorylase family protein